MDFGTLLHVAKKNANEKQPEVVRGYSTKFAPPKKETKDKKLSANIQKFLQKREQEEREKERQVREKREQLMAARDTKSRNKINKMLKVIKSANKSVLDDATDKDDTALTLAGPEQPDEDDYGYVSQESCALYKRLMDQYKTSPEEKKPSKSSNPRPLSGDNMKNTTNRVKEALTRERNEPNHRVRSEHKPSVSKSELPLPSVSFSVPEKPKPKRPPPPPPVDFNSLLKLAEKKQFEPIKVEQEIKKDERPMTMKEKREFEERRSLAEARKKRLDCVNYDYQKSGPVPAAAKASTGPTRIPKLGNATRPGAPKINPVKINPSLIPSRETKTPPTNTNQGPPRASAVIKQAKDRPPVYRATPKEVQPQERPKPQQEMPAKTRQFPPPDVQRTRQFPPPDVVRSRPFPPRDGRRPEMDRRPVKRPRIEDDYEDEDDEEYDSEMDDFIDDGPEEGSNVSKYIQEIFGYDKRRFRDEDDGDCGDMESSFVQQMREEAQSLKIGIMEDLEDIRKEEEEKALKAALKKKQHAKGRI